MGVRPESETYLADAGQDDGLAANVPFHVQAAFRRYLKCGILAHGFARVYCAVCGHDFMKDRKNKTDTCWTSFEHCPEIR